MQKLVGSVILILMIFLYAHSQVLSQTSDRFDVPDKYKWDLSDLYLSDMAWRDAKIRITTKIDKIALFKGTLEESASKLLACLKFSTEISMELRRLSSYSYNKTNQDLRDPKYRAMDQETNQLSTVYSAKSSFIEPEILAMDKKTIQKFMEIEPGLQPYRFYLNDLMRRKKRTLSEGEEKVIAEAERMSLAQSSVYNTFINADFVSTEVTLGSGETVKLDQEGFRRYKRLANKEDRKNVYRKFYAELNKWRSTFGALLNAKVNTDIFNTRTRRYGNSLEMILGTDNIPTAVFHNLIANSNKHLDTFYRYLNIRKRLLGVNKLEFTDLSVPAFDGIDLNYEIEEAKKLVLESLKPLGEEYTSIVKKALESRWIDFFPTPGKRSGGYNDFGAYAEHPYILMNYTGLYSDVATLAHELGHALHQYFADRAQPFPTTNYSSFVAEVASTLNEKLLRAKVLQKTKDDETRLFLLLSSIDSSLFDRAQISEFEWRIHREAENGSSLTGDSISGIYLETFRKYYGHDLGVCIVPDFIDMAWVFDRLLFVETYRIYAYATSQAAATMLAEKILAGEADAVRKYLDFLSAGGSDYAIDLLKKAGVDMTSSEPFDKTMDAMGRMMEEIERLLKKKKE
jgi:oligoendopeptidase F